MKRMKKFYAGMMVAAYMVLLTGSCSCSSSGSNRKATESVNETASAIVSETTTDTIVVKSIAYDHALTDIARFIAGIEPEKEGLMYALSQTEAWQKYAQQCNSGWEKYNRNISDTIRLWKEREIPELSHSFKTMFYPFSGPDFINAHLYMPNAEKYIMFGMEAPGSIPTPEKIEQERLGRYLSGFAETISTITLHSFFHTNNMAKQLETKDIYGVTPILMLFLARCEKKIIDIRPFEFAKDGKVSYLSEFSHYKGEHKYGKGVEINFTDADQQIARKLIYFSANIADGGLSINKPTREFLRTIDKGCFAYVKSATYLMHKSYFSIIRNTVMEKASLILQDESGIKYSYFDPKKWDVQLYGTYNKPINLFNEHFEQDLYDAYRKLSVKPLPFRRGYNTNSNQLLARKK